MDRKSASSFSLPQIVFFLFVDLACQLQCFFVLDIDGIIAASVEEADGLGVEFSEGGIC